MKRVCRVLKAIAAVLVLLLLTTSVSAQSLAGTIAINGGGKLKSLDEIRKVDLETHFQNSADSINSITLLGSSASHQTTIRESSEDIAVDFLAFGSPDAFTGDKIVARHTALQVSCWLSGVDPKKASFDAPLRLNGRKESLNTVADLLDALRDLWDASRSGSSTPNEWVLGKQLLSTADKLLQFQTAK